MITPRRPRFSRDASRGSQPVAGVADPGLSGVSDAGYKQTKSSAARRHRGSVLIIVVALLVLMAVIGTAYVSTARTDRGAAATGSFNTEIDLLVQGVEAMAQNAIVQDVTSNFWTAAATPTNFTSPTQQTFVSSRVPVMLSTSSGMKPGWMYLSAAPINNAVFESPYNPAGTTAAPAVLQYGTDRQNMQVSSVSVTDPSGVTVQYPALIDPKYPNVQFLAASAAGDGIADSGLFRLPCGEINGVTYYAAVRIIDNNSAVNASTAWADNNTNPSVQMQSPNIYGNFSPANVNLLNLVADGQGNGSTGISALNMYRCSGSANPSLQPYDDNGQLRNDFKFISPYDALWMQLGRRMGNPGYISASAKYQALPMTECGTLAYHFCLPNSSSSSSILEQYFPMSLRSAGMRTSPYAPSDFVNWYNQNFNYVNEMPGAPNTYLPRRALMTARNGTSNFTLNKFTSKGTYTAGTAYSFGDMVQLSGVPFNFVCIQPIAAQQAAQSPDPYAPTLSNHNLFWAIEPWADHLTKTPINTATFGQLWLAYWNVMTDDAGNVPSSDQSTIDRSPIRNPQETVTAPPGGTVAGALTPSGGDDTQNIQNAINSSNPGATITFGPGTFHVSSTLTFLNNRTYEGTGGGLPPSLTPPEVLKLRAAAAAVNALTLRAGGADVVSHLVYLGPPAAGASAGSGASILSWTGGSNQFLVATPTPGQNIGIEGITFDGADVQINGNASNVTILDCTLPGLPFPVGKVANNITITGNQFKNGNGYDYIDNNPCGNNLTITNNTFTCAGNMGAGQTVEAIHLSDGNPSGLNISNNTITGSCRNPIEVQCQATNGICSGNYIHQPNLQSGVQAYIGISWACGPSTVNGGSLAPGATYSTNCLITGNVIDNTDGQYPVPITAGWWQVQGIEYMGNGGTVSGNWISNVGFNAYTWTNGFTSSNNSWIGYTGPQPWNGEPGESNPPPTPPTISGDQSYALGNGPARPAAGATATTPPVTNAPTSNTTYSVMVYGTARNPYITKAYADNDSSIQGGGYVAIELYNPYSTPISLKNWQLATLSRPTGLVVGVPIKPLASTQGGQWAPNGIPPHSYLTLVSSSTPPPAYATGPTASSSNQVIVLNDLASALNNELVLLRTRRADGTYTGSTDPDNTFQEDPTKNANAIQDLVPVDSYDFTGLTTASGGNAPVEWYYARPDDPTQQDAWHFVYPGAYDISATTATGTVGGTPPPRLTATHPEAAGTLPFGLSTFGQPNPSGSTATISKYNDTALQLDNDQAPGPYPINAGSNASAAGPNQYPFGAFARDGDMLNSPFIGTYRIQVTQTGELVELNPVTIDSTYAKIADPATDAVTPGENIGRFAPIMPAFNQDGTIAANSTANDYSAGTVGGTNPQTPYYFALQLFDYLTTNAPADWSPIGNTAAWSVPGQTTPNPLSTYAPDSASLPNVDPNVYTTAPAPVVTLRPSSLNPTCPTVDTVPTEGLININTAPWPVLATLPMSDSAATNAALAQAIVYFRDVDDGTGAAQTPPVGLHPHGPFKTPWELNEVAVNTRSINGGTPSSTSVNGGSAISFLQTLGWYAPMAYNPATPIPAANANECGELSPQGDSNNIYNDFESQNLALTRISNLITTRSDLYTVYVLVQGWRNVGTASPSLVVQRRAAFLADRNGITDTNKLMTITNIPNN
jgi:hypothetical protein